jgi:hypothetical protein
MNPSSQLDLHPDADSLNNFVENVLPKQEHEQILAHIAGCKRCREVIYLAQEAMAAAEEPTAEALPASSRSVRSSAQIGAWIGGWRLAWGTLAACSAVAVLMVSLNLRHRAPAAELAKIGPSEIAPRPNVPQARLAGSPQTLPPQASARPSAGASHASPTRTPPRASSEPAAPIVAKARTGSPQQEEPNSAAAHTAAGGSQSTMGAQPQGGPTPAIQPAPQSESAAPPVLSGARPDVPNSGQSQAVAAAAGAPHVNSYSPTRFNGRTTATGPNRPALHAPTRSEPASGAMHFSSGLMAMPPLPPDVGAARRALNTTLPNGLTAVSTAAANHHLLAVDSAGSLFLSEDYGSTWNQVSEQWTGRALRVRVHSPAGTPSIASASKVQGTPCPTCTPVQADSGALFELVTESTSTWTSTDGKLWKQK